MPRPNAHRGQGGASRPRRGSKSKRRKPTRLKSPPTIPPDTLVSLSPAGRAFFKQLLAAASAEAGREITNFDMLELMRRVRAELGTNQPNFKIPAHMECLKKHLRALGREPPTPPPHWAQPNHNSHETPEPD